MVLFSFPRDVTIKRRCDLDIVAFFYPSCYSEGKEDVMQKQDVKREKEMRKKCRGYFFTGATIKKNVRTQQTLYAIQIRNTKLCDVGLPANKSGPKLMRGKHQR